jgi:hypothetical protein
LGTIHGGLLVGVRVRVRVRVRVGRRSWAWIVGVSRGSSIVLRGVMVSPRRGDHGLVR